MFVIALPFGQLANRLIRASHLIAASLDHGHRFADLAFGEYAEFFEGTRNDLYCRFPARKSLTPPAPRQRRAVAARAKRMLEWASRFPLSPLICPLVLPDPEVIYALDEPEFQRLARKNAVILFGGWGFRTPSVASHAAELRRHFAPAPFHAGRVDTAVTAARRGVDLLVGVHVRRGDYAEFAGGRYFWPLETYAALMRRVCALHPGRRIRFMICSNEPVRLDALGDLPVAVGPGHLVEDLYTLAQCDALIGPPSTYTMWASFYGQVPLWMVESFDEVPTCAKFIRRGV